MKQIKKYYEFLNDTKNLPFVSLSGGSRSAKTRSILQQLILFEHNKRICIVKDTLKNIKQTILLDFEDILNLDKINYKVNKTNLRYKVGTNEFHFTAFPTVDSAKGYATDILVADEADSVEKEIVEQLKMRLREKMYITYNPSSMFWANTLENKNNKLVTTFKDNPFLSEQLLTNFEEIKRRGENAPAGSYERNYYLTYYCGIFTNLFNSELFSTSDLTFQEFEVDKNLNNYSVADPSFGVGANYFACPSVFVKDNIIYCYDILLSPFVQIEEYVQRCKSNTYNFMERNGIGGGIIKKCMFEFNIANIGGFTSTDKKEKRIFNNLDGIKGIVFHEKLRNNSEFCRCIDKPKKINGYHLDLQDVLASVIILKNKGFFL